MNRLLSGVQTDGGPIPLFLAWACVSPNQGAEMFYLLQWTEAKISSGMTDGVLSRGESTDHNTTTLPDIGQS